MEFQQRNIILFVTKILDDLHSLGADLYDLSRDDEAFHSYHTYENIPMIERRYQRLLKMKEMLDSFNPKKSNSKSNGNSNNSNSKDVKKILEKFNLEYSWILTEDSIELLNRYIEDVELKRLLPVFDSNDEFDWYLVDLSKVTEAEIAASKYLQSTMKGYTDGYFTEVKYYKRR